MCMKRNPAKKMSGSPDMIHIRILHLFITVHLEAEGIVHKTNSRIRLKCAYTPYGSGPARDSHPTSCTGTFVPALKLFILNPV